MTALQRFEIYHFYRNQRSFYLVPQTERVRIFLKLEGRIKKESKTYNFVISKQHTNDFSQNIPIALD